jgi:hypothetical protein
VQAESGPDGTPSGAGSGGVPAGTPPFTVAEANRLLPFLRSALRAARDHLAELRRSEAEMLRIEAVGRTPAGALILAADHRAAQRRAAEARAHCERLLGEIAGHGCIVRDVATGLCDFPSVVDGQPVLLCWRMDEPSVLHLHGLHEGFAGRRPIPPGTP